MAAWTVVDGVLNNKNVYKAEIEIILLLLLFTYIMPPRLIKKKSG
jgi:hypothetical protein